MRLRRAVRQWLAVLSLLQVILPQATAYVDAVLERDGARVIAHVETHGTTNCVPVHAGDCVVCRMVQRTHTASAAHGIWIAEVSHVVSDAPPERARRTSEGVRLDPSSRGPPAVEMV